MRQKTKQQRARTKRIRTRPRIETLESRQMLTASPELLVDLNTSPARTLGHTVLWESSDNETVWVQNVPDEGTGTLAELTFIGPDGETSSKKIVGNVVSHSIFNGNLYLEITKDDVTDFWVTDGTSANAELADTTLREGTVETSATSSSYVLADQQFELTRTQNTVELWYSNNSMAEPLLLATDLSLNSRFVDDEDGRVYFVTQDELWSTDGTVDGTMFSSESVFDYKILTGVVAGNRLVVHDGTDVWTQRIGESPEIAFRSSTTDSSSPKWIAQLGEINFYRTGRSSTLTLWAVRSDGSAELLFEAPASDLQAIVVGDSAYFLAAPFNEAPKLFRTQGTAASTEYIADLPRGESELTAVGDKLFALIRPRNDDGGWSTEDGSAMWTSDGTTAGTVFVAETPANAISLSRISNEFNPVSFSGRLYFSTFDANAPLWQSDGTAAGTHGVSLPNLSKTRSARVVGDKLFFVGYRENEVSGEVFYLDRENELHETGAKIELSEFLLRAHTTNDRYIVGGQVFTEGGHIGQFTATDGNTAVRFEVDATSELTTVGSKIYYSTRNANRQAEYYSTDGTPEGTQLYFRETVEYESEDLGNGSIRFNLLGGDSVSEFTSDQTHVYLMTGEMIWKSDGTPENTFKIANVENIAPQRVVGPSIIPTANGDLHLLAGNSQVGEEIFRIASTPDPVSGDIDNDFDVDFADFLVLSENYGKDVDGAMADGDLDANGTIDFADFLLLAEMFGEDLRRPI